MAEISTIKRGYFAQWTIGYPFGGNSRKDRHRDPGRKREGDCQQRKRLQPAGAGHCLEGKVAGHGPEHEYFAVGEIDHLQDSVDQRIPDSHQGINRTQHQAIGQLL